MPKYTFMGPGSYKPDEKSKAVEVGDEVTLTEQQAAGLRSAGIMLEEAGDKKDKGVKADDNKA